MPDYLYGQYKHVPDMVFVVSFCILCLAIVVICIAKRDGRSVAPMVCGSLLLEYVFLVLCSTVICRTSVDEIRYNLEPFWSYRAIADGQMDIMYEVVLNAIMAMPLGLLLPIIYRNRRFWLVMITGVGFSILIELLQLTLHRGLCEFDDVWHNTIGCIMGYLLFCMLNKMGGRDISEIVKRESENPHSDYAG